MEFTDVVMKRRAVRRFEDGGVDREVIERIARLAQRTPSAGFSQGQRLVVVTDPARRREVARICGEEEYEPDFGPWISECAAQFIPCVSEAIYHRRTGAGQDDGGRLGDRVAGAVLVDRHRGDDAEHHAGRGERGPRLRVRRAGDRCVARLSRHPRGVRAIGVMPLGRPLPDVRSPSLKRGWVPLDQFARWEAWG